MRRDGGTSVGRERFSSNAFSEPLTSTYLFKAIEGLPRISCAARDFGEPHAAFLNESRTSGRVQCSVQEIRVAPSFSAQVRFGEPGAPVQFEKRRLTDGQRTRPVPDALFTHGLEGARLACARRQRPPLHDSADRARRRRSNRSSLPSACPVRDGPPLPPGRGPPGQDWHWPV